MPDNSHIRSERYSRETGETPILRLGLGLPRRFATRNDIFIF